MYKAGNDEWRLQQQQQSVMFRASNIPTKNGA
jgi:hypothetical protein